jgi:pyruvate-ferredoxin/flavodoxin oxidoreductase
MDHEAQIAQLKRDYPQQIARRLAEGLMRHGGGGALAELLATLPQKAPAAGAPVAARSVPGILAEKAPTRTLAPEPAVSEPVKPGPAQAAVKDDEPVTLEAYIDSARCTTCNECINLNKKVFAYNAAKQAEIKDARAGTFQQLVLAAERCPVSIIHPGSPGNPDEKDLAKWVKRAEKFN